MKFKDLSHLDRNLESLVQDLSIRCQHLFWRASYATGQSANISHGSNASTTPTTRSTLPKQLRMRERTIQRKDQVRVLLACIEVPLKFYCSGKEGGFVQYLAMQSPPIADTSFRECPAGA